MRLIDADALEEMFKTQYECETCDNYDGVRCRACHCDDALGIIDSTPTVDAAPVRRGEWKYFHKQNRAVCTQCSFERNLDTDFGAAVSCPNCGADMKGMSE